MFIPFQAKRADLETCSQDQSGKRRGTTSLEYLAMISLILVVLILAVQHLGIVTGGLFTSNAKATSSTIHTGP